MESVLRLSIGVDRLTGVMPEETRGRIVYGKIFLIWTLSEILAMAVRPA